MRIQYFSDIHLEFYDEFDFSIIKREAPVLVLAGDLGNPFKILYSDLIRHVSTLFDKVFIITGNHEYYSKSKTQKDVDTEISSMVSSYDNITYLNNTYEDYDGFRFIGTTLWSYISNHSYLTNDFYYIPWMSVDMHNSLHRDALSFIKNNVKEQNTIIISHHVPAYSLIDSRYSRYSSYNQCFATSLEYLLKPPIRCWFYGHTHIPCHKELNGVQMCCNPIGYPNENSSPDFGLVVDIS